MVVFLALQVGILSIAATLWLDFRRDQQRRRRLVKSVESISSREEVSCPEKTGPLQGGLVDQLSMDFLYSLRTLRRSPAFTFVAVLVLALGIGATTAIFSVVNAVLIRPLPYKEPSRLVAVSSLYLHEGASRAFATVSLDEVERWRAESRSLASVGSFVFTAMPVNVGARTLFLAAIGADPELLDTLGIQPALGRNLPGSGSMLKDPGVIISHRLWVDAFQLDPHVLGRPLALDGAASTVAGVLPASFQFPRFDASYFAEQPDIIFPVANIVDGGWARNSTQWFAIGRLNPGVPATAAEAELRTITSRMAAGEPGLRGISVHLSTLSSETTKTVRPALLLTLGISVVLLLIACTNITSLLFSRAAQRGREMAVRKAIGASNWQIVRQMLIESGCLTFFAGAVGVVLARFAVDTLVNFSPAHLPISGRVGIDWIVLGFAFAVCAAAAILAGTLPAVHRSRQTETLIAATRSTESRVVLQFQRALMVAQIALGVGLLSAAGLLAHSLFHLSSVNPGFRSEGTLAFELAFPSGHRGDAARLHQRILEATRNVPGVVSAGWITNPPPETRAGVFIGFSIPGSSSTARPFCNFQVTSEDYFNSAGIALSRGRDFSKADTAGAPRVAIVNETLARQYFPNADPVGKRITVMWDGSNSREIVGVIHDIHDRGLSAKPAPTVYVPYGQMALAYGGVVARTSAPPETIIPELRRRITAVDPGVAVKNFSTIAARLRRTLDAPRFYTAMATACALMAVLFVTLGLYGVISYAVSRRTSEIGIRMALGAPGASIRRGVLVQGLQMAVAGVAMGIALSLAATRLLGTLLFEIRPIDPPTLVISATLVILVAVAASYIPARRASLVHPMVALRQE
jgi:predicted permease